MSLLRELESIKYSTVVDLIKRDENYDKKRSVLTGEEVFKLCHNRYLALQELLLPLKEKLGKNIEITDIGLVHGMQDDTSIVVKYNDNGKLNFFTITNSDYDDIEIDLSNDYIEKYGFVLDNKKIIMDILTQISINSLDSEFYLNSTSGKFIVLDNCKSFAIKDTNAKIFCLEGNHLLYKKSGLMYDPEKTICAYSKLKEMLTEEDNIQSIYQHLRVYEEDFPKTLIKKLIDD